MDAPQISITRVFSFPRPIAKLIPAVYKQSLYKKKATLFADDHCFVSILHRFKN